ncbi:MAG: translation elongation factor Ts, partial [Actinomycetota bacterium]|nr:translation elongation factor Ts [Actinomycetota bacterium]
YTNPEGTVGVLVEVNCETDFVARNDDFKSFVTSVASHICSAAPADETELMGQPFVGREDLNVEQILGEVVGKLGENMAITRFTRMELAADAGAVTVYVHGVGNIAVMAEISAANADAASSDAFKVFAKDASMQIAATAPLATMREDVPADIVAHELSIYKAQAAESGKPEQIQEKIAEGRLNKYFKEVTLLEQDFVKDTDISLKQYMAKMSKEAGGEIAILRFERLVLGETAKAAE